MIGLRRRVGRHRNFLAGMAVGIGLVLGAWTFVNNTRAADLLVGPLMLPDTSGRGDVIFVLGAAVKEDCSLNVFGLRRVILAARLYHSGRAPLVLISGGRQRDMPCAVADVMADLVVDLGVPRSRVLVETASGNTWENAAFSDPILRSLNASRLVVVTDRLHMRRAEACLRRFGYDTERASVPVSDSHPDNVSMLGGAAHEIVGLAYYWLDGRLRHGGTARAAQRRPSSWSDQTPRGAEGNMPDVKFPNGPVVILGASYAGGWMPELPDARFINAGVGGQQSFELLERIERDVLAHQPRAVIVWGFINDIVRSPPEQLDRALAGIRESLQGIVSRARAAGIEPILATEVTIRPRDNWGEWAASWAGWMLGKRSYQQSVNEQVLGMNRWLQDYANGENLLVLDLQPVLSDAKGVRRREFAAEDGSHISPAGYQALTEYAAPLLRARLFGAHPDVSTGDR